jgi:hypothetical protein
VCVCVLTKNVHYRNGYNNFLVACLDKDLYADLCELGYCKNAAVVPRKWMHKDIVATEVLWEQKPYIFLTQVKIFITHRFIQVRVCVCVSTKT